MTNDQPQTPALARKVFINIKNDAKRLLATGNCRALLVAGSVIGTSMIAVAIFLSTTVISASPSLASSENYLLVNGIMFTVAAFFTVFFFPPIYCGLYNCALITANKETADFRDLFKFYSTPKLYSRSIKIFFCGFWYLYGIVLILGITYTILGVCNEYFPDYFNSVSELGGSLLYSFIIFGGIAFFSRRRFKFIYIPMAVENPELSIRQCSRSSTLTGYIPMRMYLPGDTIKTFALLAASVLTIGILYILYAAPRAVVNKTAYYKAIKID